MKRRDALTLAGTTGAALLGGCLGSASSGDDGTATDTPTGTPTKTTATGGDTTTAPDDGTTTVAAEETWVRGHDVRTTNTDCFSGAQSVTATLSDGTLVLGGVIKAGTPCHVATVESASAKRRTVEVTVGVESDGSGACVQCVGSVEYEATLEYDGATPEHVVVRHRTMDGTTTVLDSDISTNGGVGASVGEDTAQAPSDDEGDGSGDSTGSDSDGSTPDGSADVTEDYGLRTVDTDCGSGGRASIVLDGDRVRVKGSIGASNPCHRAVLRSAGMEGGRYVIEVGTREADVDTCMSCLGVVDYEATVAFPDGAPETVAVVHHSMGERTEVATATR